MKANVHVTRLCSIKRQAFIHLENNINLKPLIIKKKLKKVPLNQLTAAAKREQKNLGTLMATRILRLLTCICYCYCLRIHVVNRVPSTLFLSTPNIFKLFWFWCHHLSLTQQVGAIIRFKKSKIKVLLKINFKQTYIFAFNAKSCF